MLHEPELEQIVPCAPSTLISTVARKNQPRLPRLKLSDAVL